MNQNRLRQVIANMKGQGLEQIVVSATASVYYLTGIWVSPMERMLALYITTEGQCTLYANELFGIEPQPGMELVLHSDSDEPTAQLARQLRPGKLGVDKFWPSKFLIALLEARSDITPVMGSGPVDDARMFKDEEERQAMRRASQLNDRVVRAAIDAIGQGAKETEIAQLVETMYSQNGGNRTEGMIVSFGAHGADPHHSPSDVAIQPGDSVVLDLFAPIQRYWCDMTRTVFYQSVTDEQRRVYETVTAGQRRGGKNDPARGPLVARWTARPGASLKRRAMAPTSPTAWATAAAWNATSRLTTAMSAAGKSAARHGVFGGARHLPARPLRRPHRGPGIGDGRGL